MRQEIIAAMASWHDSDSVDLVEEMFTLTTTIALRVLFSSQLDPGQAERLRRAFDIFLRHLHRGRAPLAGQGCPPRQPPVHKSRSDLMSRMLAARDENG